MEPKKYNANPIRKLGEREDISRHLSNGPIDEKTAANELLNVDYKYLKTEETWH